MREEAEGCKLPKKEAVTTWICKHGLPPCCQCLYIPSPDVSTTLLLLTMQAKNGSSRLICRVRSQQDPALNGCVFELLLPTLQFLSEGPTFHEAENSLVESLRSRDSSHREGNWLVTAIWHEQQQYFRFPSFIPLLLSRPCTHE